MRRIGRFALVALELLVLSALIVATRCANYEEVFVARNIYFTDADCYARMTRVRICAANPGTIVRHHDFENFPTGTTPHTTAPLDYAILLLSILLKPFTAHPVDFAGAIVSPLLALFGAWFLWWWSKQFRFRWVLLLLYAISPIVVHATKLGRPDHQSLALLLVSVGICSELSLRRKVAGDPPSPSYGAAGTPAATGRSGWSTVSGVAWSLAMWVSLYEPVALFVAVMIARLLENRDALIAPHRRIGWAIFAAILVVAAVVERRLPLIPSGALFWNWSGMVGEMAHVPLASTIWFEWVGWGVVVVPFLAWRAFRTEREGAWVPALLLLSTFLLTNWQARWGAYFAVAVAVALLLWLQSIHARVAVFCLAILSMFPIVAHWDRQLWPSEVEIARQSEARLEAVHLREACVNLLSAERQPFLAPWWYSPAITYWSGQPGVAGSSHESLPGIVDSAEFFLAVGLEKAREIIDTRGVRWVIVYDAERVTENSAGLLRAPIPAEPLCRILDRTPSQAPPFLLLAGQTGTFKAYNVRK